MRHRASLLVLALGATVLSLATAAAAQKDVVIWANSAEKPMNASQFTGTAYDVGVDATHFFDLRTAAAGYTLLQRACICDARITEALSLRVTGPVTISPIRGKPTIYVGPVQLVTVYPRDVAANHARSALALAKIWAANLRAGLPKVVPGGTKSARMTRVYIVAINGQLIFRLRDRDGFPDVDKRGVVVEKRVWHALSNRAKKVTCAPTDNGTGIFADGERIVEVTPVDAESTGSTPEAVAKDWAVNLRAGLGLIAPK